MKKEVIIFFALVLIVNNSYAQSAQSAFKEVYISNIPKPTAPAVLEISDISFSDREGNGNNILDANEKGELIFTIFNSGKGGAYNLVAEIEDKAGINGIDYNEKYIIGELESKRTKKIRIPITGKSGIESGKARFKIVVREANHFDADPIEITLNTQQFKNPILNIDDFTFSTKESGKIKSGEMVTLTMIVQNIGQGSASDISIAIKNPENVYPGDKTDYYISSLKANENNKIVYEFFANKQYTQKDIPLEVTITESYKKYGVTKTISVSLEESLAKTTRYDVNSSREEDVKITHQSLNSDVDKNIPTIKKVYTNRYALVIGNEDYTSQQVGLSTESNVDFANNDAKVFAEYCNKTMGVPLENISLLPNASVGKMKSGIEKLKKLLKNSDGSLEIIFYYAGHGLPDENTHEPYIIPVDVSGSDVQNAIKVSDLYQSLTEYPSKRVTVFLDACFSGGGRNQGLLTARTVNIKPKNGVLQGNLVVFSASSSDELSMSYKEKQHGIFTYFLLKKLQETKGEITYKDLGDFIKTRVSFESVKINSKEQHPIVSYSTTIADQWLDWSVN